MWYSGISFVPILQAACCFQERMSNRPLIMLRITLSTYFWMKSLRGAKLFSGRPRSSSKSLRQAFMVRLLQIQHSYTCQSEKKAITACGGLNRCQKLRTHSRFVSICFRRCFRASLRASSLTFAMLTSHPVGVCLFVTCLRYSPDTVAEDTRGDTQRDPDA